MILPHVTLNTGHVASIDLARVDAAATLRIASNEAHVENHMRRKGVNI